MKKILLGILGLFVLGLLVSLVFYFLRKPAAPAEPVMVTDPFGNLIANHPSSTTASTNAILTLRFPDGTSAAVPDFTKDNQPEWAGSAGYRVIGNPTADYMVTFVPSDSSGNPATVTMILQNEPLGAVRAEAETALRAKLNLTNDQLCKVGVAVYTQPGLSDIYDAKNLGLSFCLGAVKLP